MSEYESYLQRIEELKKPVPGTTLQKGTDFPDFDALRPSYSDPGYAVRKAKAAAFIDDDSMLEFLASERFPDDPAAAFRYQIKNGEIVYEDIDGQIKQEFRRPSDASMLDEYITPNIVPASTFVADLGGGMYGAKKGFEIGVKQAKKLPIKNPFAISAVILGSTAIGGGLGNLVSGGAARAARAAAIDQFYNLPPEEIKASLEDLGVSMAFSAIPFGAGPTRDIISKFTGREDTLRKLLALKGSVQDKIDEAAKAGIQLTAAEAGDIAGAMGANTIVARQLQHFLSQQPQIQKIKSLYNSRAQRISEAITVFADSMASVGPKFKDANQRVSAVAAHAMKELRKRREGRASRLYESMRRENLPEGVEPAQIDLSGVISSLDDLITNPKTDRLDVAAAEEFKDSLMARRVVQQVKRDKDGLPEIDASGREIMEEVEVLEPLTDLMDIHDRRTRSMEAVIRKNFGTGTGILMRQFRKDVTDLLDAADPTYNLARRVYDPTKASQELIEASAVGRLSNFFGRNNDKVVAKAIREVFDPNSSVQSLRNARRVLKAASPETWQDTKQYFLNEQLENFTKTQLMEGGVPNFQRHFATPKYQRMMETLLEPEEFENFNRLMGFMDRAFNTVPRGGSQTQSATALEDILAKEAPGYGSRDVGTSGLKLTLAAIRLPGRIATGQVADDLLQRIALKQQEVYYNALTDVLLGSPDAKKSIEDAYNYIDLFQYGSKQGMTRGASEVKDIFTTPSAQDYEPTEGGEQRILEQLEALERNNQSSINVTPDIPEFEALPQGPSAGPTMGQIDPAMSPTILPSDKDRELAMRLRGPLGGIASLA